MSNYESLKSRMDEGEVIILDGAIGTELQTMGAPMDPASWCGPANYTHYATVRLMHQRYIKAGADIITTNTFNTIRPALEASGYIDKVREINTRAVDAAIEARDRVRRRQGRLHRWLHRRAGCPFATQGPARCREAPATATAPAFRRRS